MVLTKNCVLEHRNAFAIVSRSAHNQKIKCLRLFVGFNFKANFIYLEFVCKRTKTEEKKKNEFDEIKLNRVYIYGKWILLLGKLSFLRSIVLRRLTKSQMKI